MCREKVVNRHEGWLQCKIFISKPIQFAAWPRDRHVGTCPCLLSFLATYKLCSNFQVTTEKDSRFGRAVQTIACLFFFCTLPRLGAAFAKPCCLSLPVHTTNNPAQPSTTARDRHPGGEILSRYDWLIDTMSYFDWLVFYEAGKFARPIRLPPPGMSGSFLLAEN